MSYYDRMRVNKVRKGDKPGHPFRGNQFKNSGEGGGEPQAEDKFSKFNKAHSEVMRSLSFERERASHDASLDARKESKAREAVAAYDQASRDYVEHPHGPQAQKAENISNPREAREAMSHHLLRSKDSRFPKDVQEAHQRAVEMHARAADRNQYDNAIANVANARDASKAAHEKEMVARGKMQEDWKRRGIKSPRLWMGA